MKIKILYASLLLSSFFAALVACTRQEQESVYSLKPDLPFESYSYVLQGAPQFGNPDSTQFIDIFFGFSFNTLNPGITNAGATLGRVLFYDPQLSLNNSVSCASCHHQDKAFSDGKAFSTGFAGEVTPRSSMAIINAGFNNNLFWDSRVNSVMELSTKPIQNHIEMGMESMDRLSSKLSKIDYYPELFEKAFGPGTITAEQIAVALTQFVCSISSFNSKFDQAGLNGFVSFTPQERAGLDLFMSDRTNCSKCHAGQNFSAPDFEGGPYGRTFMPSGGETDLRGGANNGLELSYADQGIDNGRFRIPSLRNISLTAPYMHDGRFATLGEVIEHYNSGISGHSSLDANLRDKNGNPLRMNLNTAEKQALLAFLYTLTDEGLAREEKWSNPFK